MSLRSVRRFIQVIGRDKVIDIPNIFKSEYLIILAKARNYPDTWHRAGYLTQFVDTLSLKQVQVLNRNLILLNTPTIQPFLFWQLGYKLRFEVVNWIETLTIEIHEPIFPVVLDTNKNETASNDMAIARQHQQLFFR